MLSFKEYNQAVKESFGGIPQNHDVTGLKKVFPELLDKKKRRKYMIGQTPADIQQQRAKRKALVKKTGTVIVTEQRGFTVVDPFGGVKYKNVRRGYVKPGVGSRYRFKSVSHQEPSSFRNDFPIVKKFKDFIVHQGKKTLHNVGQGIKQGIHNVAQYAQHKNIENKQKQILALKAKIEDKKAIAAATSALAAKVKAPKTTQATTPTAPATTGTAPTTPHVAPTTPKPATQPSTQPPAGGYSHLGSYRNPEPSQPESEVSKTTLKTGYVPKAARPTQKPETTPSSSEPSQPSEPSASPSEPEKVSPEPAQKPKSDLKAVRKKLGQIE